MVEYSSSFLGSVLKTIVCTPNQNFDNEAYKKGVIEPTQKIRKLVEELGEQKPSVEQMREVMTLLLTILKTKMVSMDERESRIKEILDSNHLNEVFPNLLPLTGC